MVLSNKIDPVLKEALLSSVALFVDGISEYQLIKYLQQPPWCLFAGLDLSDQLEMFRCHFILFNALYTISDRFYANGIGELHIHTLNIALKPKAINATSLRKIDNLKAYYLNWDNLNQTTDEDVTALLNEFWHKMAGVHNELHFDPQAISEAKVVFEFDQHLNPSAEQIKRQYRKLLQQHHPDKGGTKQKAQRIGHAYRILRNSTAH